MKIELIDLTEENMRQCFEMRVASNQKQYIASNEDSWKTAKENEKVARTFGSLSSMGVIPYKNRV